MKKCRRLLFLTLAFVMLRGILFGYVSPSYAQQQVPGWTEPLNLSFSGIASDPILVIDFKNALHAIWLETDGTYKYSQSTDGITWTNPQLANFPFVPGGSLPTLVSDAGGSIHIFWINKDAELFYAESTPLNLPKAGNWQTITLMARHVVNYDVILDSQGALHLGYVHTGNSIVNPAGIYYRQMPVNGSSWTAEAKLYESAYLRSAVESETSVRVAVSNTFPDQKVYVTWDNQAQKRVFMAVSSDAGLSWSEATQIKGVADTGGINTPFNLNVAAANDQLLIIWQVGTPGSTECALFSQWSQNAGESWEATKVVLGGHTDCPARTKFVIQNENYMVAMLSAHSEHTLIAWNGDQWSQPQTQTQLPTFSNPVTSDAILFGCRVDTVHEDHLYVIGCDQARGGDVWFLSRPLEPLENWFSPPITWGIPVVTVPETKKNRITNLSSASDADGNIHTFWVESSSTNSLIDYARWNGEDWIYQDAVIPSLSGTPVQLTVATDSNKRVLLAWVDGNSGALFFSWANADRANLESEWKESIGMPSVSGLNSSPDLLVDGSGRIIIAYAVPINEQRGIYIVQSTDGGNGWSSPARAVDAVSAGWERIDAPKISLDANGVLHLIFSRITMWEDQPTGLYYSRSMDGGVTWSEAQMISDSNILWSDILSYDKQTVHIIWQEYDRLVYANFSQVSQDGGTSWSKPVGITGVNDYLTPVSLAWDGSGQMHFVQLTKDLEDIVIKQDNLVLEDWSWTGSGWEFASKSDVLVRGDGLHYSVTAGLTSKGSLGVSISVEYSDAKNVVQNEIQTFNRYLGNSTTLKDPAAVLLPTPMVKPDATEVPTVPPAQPADLTILYDDNISITSTQRNTVGVVIIGMAMMVIVFLLVRSRPKAVKK